MSAPFVTGTMQEYISNIDFSLNFEDKTKSVKVRMGEIVVYDGNIARYPWNQSRCGEFKNRSRS
jgi:hypothetical protein